MSANATAAALKCVHCGYCLDACPTYRLTGNEANSPRGRIYLIRSVDRGEIDLDANVLAMTDACLGCRACQTVCPSGVEYSTIIEEFRSRVEASGKRPATGSFARRRLLETLTRPALFAATMRAGRLVGDGRTLPSPVAALLAGDHARDLLLSDTSGPLRVGVLAERYPAIGTRRLTVGLLAGCVTRVLFHDTNEATIRVLCRSGCDVVVPRAAGCCGALHAHSGFVEDARRMARALIDAFDRFELDAVVTNSAGCGSTLKEYGALLAGDPAYASRARAFAAKARDVTEVLDEIGVAGPLELPETVVAYHDACHLAHGQGVVQEPRRLLASIRGVRLVDLPEPDTCCGSAGIYNVVQPAMARALLDRKIENVLSTGAKIVAAGNPGCVAWMRRAAKDRGLDLEIVHPVMLLDRAQGNRETIRPE